MVQLLQSISGIPKLINLLITVDHLNRTIAIPSSVKRIVSLVPSQTELLADLKLNDEVVGITNFCIYPPEWFKSKNRVGGTKNFNINKIRELNPDLIIANKEENSKSKLEILINDYPVWISDVRDLSSALDMINSVGKIVQRESIATEIKNNIQKSFNDNIKLSSSVKKVAYLIWNNPLMTINQDTFIHQMISINGWKNCFASHSSRYPEITMNELKESSPDLVFLSSEPFPFSSKHLNQFKKEIPSTKAVLVNGEYFSWYGSKLLKSPNYFNQLKRELFLD